MVRDMEGKPGGYDFEPLLHRVAFSAISDLYPLSRISTLSGRTIIGVGFCFFMAYRQSTNCPRGMTGTGRYSVASRKSLG